MLRKISNETLETSVIKSDLSSLDLSLVNATYEFRKEYILAIAKQTAKFDIYAISRELKYDRSELSKFVNESAVKPQLNEVQKTYNPNDWYSKNHSQTTNPITREVIAEAISDNNFDIKKATTRFKKRYVSHKVKQYGIKKAAELLLVSERTIRNHLVENIFSSENIAAFVN